MADTTTPTRGRKQKPAATPALTAYVVLKAIDLNAVGLDDEQRKALGIAGHVTRLWAPVLEDGGEVRVISAASKDKAIRAVTGEDGPDILEGSWKAVSVTAFRGGTTTRRTMKSDRLPLDEAL